MYSITKIETILVVPSIEDTVEWYERVLGWSGHFDVHDDEGDCLYGSVFLQGAGGVGLNLSRYMGDGPYNPDSNTGFAALVYVDDVDEVYRRAASNQAEVSGPPQPQSWASRTFTLKDLNGFTLIFAQQS